jgi:tetratricopeptide (TPR) repeat protein
VLLVAEGTLSVPYAGFELIREGERKDALKVFLSYGRDDDRSVIDQLAHELENHFEVWRDEASMPSRGRSYMHEIRSAIQRADRVVLAIGPAALRSDNVRMEWQYALSIGRVVVPVWLSRDFRVLPPELKNLHTIRLDEDGSTALVRVLRDDPPLLGQLHDVPQVPPHYRPRTDVLSRLASVVLFDHAHPIVIGSDQRRTVVRGMGGSGKTVIAAAFARSSSARHTFVDGVFWFNERSGTTGEQVKESVLRQFQDASLATRTCLFVLDNVETAAFVRPITQIMGPNCRVLVTTRDAGLVPGAQDVPMVEMSERESLEFIGDWTRTPVDGLPALARDVAAAVGRNIYALALAGAYLSSPAGSYDGLLAALRDADLEFMRRDLGYEYESVMRMIHASVVGLAPEDLSFFAQLIVLDRGATIPADLVRRLWQRGGLSPSVAGRLLIELEAKALVRVERERVSLHDLLHLYLQSRRDDAGPIHERLLVDLGWPDGWSATTSDPYLFEQLSHHLVGAGRHRELVELLTRDARWMRASLAVLSDVRAVCADVVRALETDTTDAEFVRLHAVWRAARAEVTRYSPDELRALVCLGESRLATSCARFGSAEHRLIVLEETRDTEFLEETIQWLRGAPDPDARASLQASLAVLAGPRSTELFEAAANSAADVADPRQRENREAELAVCLMRAGRFDDAAKISARVTSEPNKADLSLQEVWRLCEHHRFEDAEQCKDALDGYARARALLIIVEARSRCGEPPPTNLLDELVALARHPSAHNAAAPEGPPLLAIALAALGHFDDPRFDHVLNDLVEHLATLDPEIDLRPALGSTARLLATVDTPEGVRTTSTLLTAWRNVLEGPNWIPNLYPERRSLARCAASLAAILTRHDVVDGALELADGDRSDLHGIEILDAIALEAARGRHPQARALLDKAIARRDAVANVEVRAAILGTLAEMHIEHRDALVQIAVAQSLDDPRALHQLVDHLVHMGRLEQARELAGRIDHIKLKASADNMLVVALVRAGDREGAKKLIDDLVDAFEPRKMHQAMGLAWLGHALAEAGWLKQAQRMPSIVTSSQTQWRIAADVARRRFTSAIRRAENLNPADRTRAFCKIAAAQATVSEARARETFVRAKGVAGNDDDANVAVVMAMARCGYADLVEQTVRSIHEPRARALAWAAAAKLVTDVRGHAPGAWLAEAEAASAKCAKDQCDEPLRLLARARATCKQDALPVIDRITDPAIRAQTTQDVANILAHQGDVRAALALLAIDSLEGLMKWLLRCPRRHFWEAAKVAAWVAPLWEQLPVAPRSLTGPSVVSGADRHWKPS